jgi:hypothetical protein
VEDAIPDILENRVLVAKFKYNNLAGGNGVGKWWKNGYSMSNLAGEKCCPGLVERK